MGVSTISYDELLKIAVEEYREAHEWSCRGRHGGLCTSNGGDMECDYPPPEGLEQPNKDWLQTKDGRNNLEYGRWWREEAGPIWPNSPGTSPKYIR